jgi:GPH family glycoside/pentoside/hexuronide:cation symporter
MADAGLVPAEAAISDRLSLRRKLGFAAGDFSLNLYWQAIGLFLLFFYTDVLGISPSWAGATFFLASVWDGINDPIVGMIADRTRSRSGRYRPYLLFGCVPLAVSFVLAFSMPGLTGPALVAYALGTHILLRTAYGFVSIPYSSLSARLTRDADDRTSLTGYRMQFAAFGGIAVTFLMPALVATLGRANLGQGYFLATLSIGTLAVAGLLLCFLNTKEPAIEEANDRARSKTHGQMLAELRGFLGTVGRNGPLLRLLSCNAMAAASISLVNKNLLYFFKYELHDFRMAGLVLPGLAFLNILVMPVWVVIIKRTSKRAAWLMGCGIAAAGCLAFGLNPSHDLAAQLAPLVMTTVGAAAFGVCFWSMLPDIVEFNQWKFGRHDEAKIFGFASFAQKVALGASAVAAGLLLDYVGLIANAEQAPETLHGLRVVMSLIPLSGVLLSAWIVRRYPIDRPFHRRILAELTRASVSGPARPPARDQAEAAIDKA